MTPHRTATLHQTEMANGSILFRAVPDIPGVDVDTAFASVVALWKCDTNVVHIVNAALLHERGQGWGIAMYRAVVDWALNHHCTTRDINPSDDGKHVYRALERRGYQLEIYEKTWNVIGK